MRNRDKKLSDFGLPSVRKEYTALYKHLQTLGPEDRARLHTVCRAACPDDYIADCVFKSLSCGISYDKFPDWVPVGRDDFYAYRRKVTAIWFGRVPAK